MLKAIIKIANFTHFDLETISNLTLKETNEILDIIRELEQERISVKLAIADYQILLSRDGDKKQAQKNQTQANKIREILAGKKQEKQSNLGFFQSLGIYTNKKII